jgi:hypothetical protein
MLLINMLLIVIELEVTKIAIKRRKQNNEEINAFFPLYLYLLYILFEMIVSSSMYV